MWWAIYFSPSGREEDFDGTNDGIGCQRRPKVDPLATAEN